MLSLLSNIFSFNTHTTNILPITRNSSVSLITNSVIFANIYEINKPIRERVSCCTYIVTKRSDNMKYFMKIRRYEIEMDVIIQYIIHKILSKTNHDNIIKFYDLQNIGNVCCMIYEYLPYSTLTMYRKQTKPKLSIIFNIFNQILSGLLHLHEYNIIHCDLKLDNILIHHNQIKIIDFDMSKICDSNGYYVSDKIFGTMNFIAPESYDLGIYSKKSDVWAFGIIMYILITNVYPYGEKLAMINSYSNLFKRNEFKHIDMELLRIKLSKQGCRIGLFELLCNMLQFNEIERYDTKMISKKIEINNIYEYTV